MKWMTPEEVPDAFGPKALGDPLQTNWAITRYVPWTSWVSAATNWPNAQGNTSVEAESSGMSTYAHELSHNLSHPRQLRQPVRRHAAARLHGHVGHDEPRDVQRSGRPPHALQHPADGWLRARLAAQHPQQALPELRRRHRPDAPQPQRARVSGIAVADVTAREVPHADGRSAACRSRSTAPSATTRPRASSRPTGAATASRVGHDDHRQVQRTTRWKSCSRSARTPTTRATAS